MRICLINTLYPPTVFGGAELSTASLAVSLARRGHEIHVATLEMGNPMNELESVDEHGVHIHRIRPCNVGPPFSADKTVNVAKRYAWHAVDSYNWVMGSRLAALLKTISPEIVHTNNIAGFSAAAWVTARRLHVPVVHTLRDYYALCPRTSMYKSSTKCDSQCMSCKLLTIPRRLATFSVRAVVGVSRYILERHLSLHYFPNSLSATVINNSYGVETVPRQLGMDAHDGTFTVGYLGRVCEEKGIEILLGAMANSRKNVRLVVAGRATTEYMDYLRDKYSDTRVEYLGYVPSSTLLSSVHALCMPSLLPESFGRGVVEAYAAGVPVIAARSGGLAELVKDGRTGFLHDPLDVGGLRNSIARLATDRALLRTMQSEALAAAPNFSPELVADRYEATYSKCLETA